MTTVNRLFRKKLFSKVDILSYRTYIESMHSSTMTTSNKRSVIIPMSKIDLFSVYLNQELKEKKDVSARQSHFMPYML